MPIVPSKAQIRLLSFGLAMALIFIGPAFEGSGRAPRSPAMDSKKSSELPPSDISAEVDKIRALVAQYAKSIDDADTALASEIWSDSTEVSFIHPLGHEHGLEQIKQNVYQHLMGDTFSERKLTPRDISVHVYGDAAWVEFYWDFAAKFRKDGSPISTHGRETQVYRKELGRWRLVHVHYSGMPVVEERKGF